MVWLVVNELRQIPPSDAAAAVARYRLPFILTPRHEEDLPGVTFQDAQTTTRF
ncbi:hypothetical protein SBA4_4410012 [Candidatus Sulfopaludibacter sp. SbA4]|nr:hypothetical protein SBA4_4410012 [Candidatus Sulfopaludibacter sp. SbA4]